MFSLDQARRNMSRKEFQQNPIYPSRMISANMFVGGDEDDGQVLYHEPSGTSVSLDTDHTWKLFQDDMGHYRVASDGGEKSIFAKTLIHKCPTPKPAAAKAAAKAAAGTPRTPKKATMPPGVTCGAAPLPGMHSPGFRA